MSNIATDATGTPTTYASLPTYNTAVDAPSGKGFNAMVQALDTWLQGKIQTLGGDLSGTLPNPTIKGSVGLTGAPTAPTAVAGTNTTQLATTAFVNTATTGAAGGDLAGTYPNPTVKSSVALSGSPTTTTQAVTDSTTKIATTAYANALVVRESPYVDMVRYADIATGLAACSAGQSLLLYPGTTYNLAGQITLPHGVSMFSPNPYRGAYAAGGARVTGSVAGALFKINTLGFAGKQTIEGITFQNTNAAGAASHCFETDFNGDSISWLRFYDCMFVATAGATDRIAISFFWPTGASASGTVEQCYFEHCGFSGFDSGIWVSGDAAYTKDFDKCVIEKCRFDNAKGTAGSPAQIHIAADYIRAGAIRDCVFEGSTNGARSGINLAAQFQCFVLDNCYMESMATQLTATYDEIIVTDPVGAVTPGACLSVIGCRLGDLGASTNVPRYSLNLETLSGAFKDSVLTESCLISGCNIGYPIRLSRQYGTPANSIKVFASNCTTS